VLNQRLVTSSAPELLTYAALLDLDESVRAEILSGELVVSPAPLPRHSKAQGAVRRFVGGPFDDDHGRGGPGGWWIFVEVDVQLGPHDVEALALEGRHWKELGVWDEEAVERIAPFEAVELEIARLFLPRGADRVEEPE